MEIFFQDPSEVPLPPDEVRIRSLRAEPYPDGRRVRIYVEVDPFQARPSVDLEISDAQGRQQATASIIESMARKMEIVMHLRDGQPGTQYHLAATLYFSQPNPQSGEEPQLPQRKETDRKEINFSN
jgi:hypothetical protein